MSNQVTRQMSVIELYLSSIEEDLSKVDLEIGKGKDCSEKACKALFRSIQDTEKQAKIELRLVEDAGEKDRFKALTKKVASKKSEVAKALLMDGADSTVFLGSTGKGKSESDRKRLEAVNERVDRQNETIERLQRVVADTEVVGAEIMTELGENREKIVSSREKAQDIDTDLSDAESRMKRMQRRADAGGCQIM